MNAMKFMTLSSKICFGIKSCHHKNYSYPKNVFSINCIYSCELHCPSGSSKTSCHTDDCHCQNGGTCHHDEGCDCPRGWTVSGLKGQGSEYS